MVNLDVSGFWRGCAVRLDAWIKILPSGKRVLIGDKMKRQFVKMENVPAVIYGEKSDKVYIFIHGKQGYKEEGEDLAGIVCKKGYQVISIDLPGHGERKAEAEDFLPWKVLFWKSGQK